VAYKNFVVIGLGTLGGFIAEAISNLENTEKIVIIDHDIVESKNLRNSIYRQIDLGCPKVEALKDIISYQNPDIEVWAFKTEYAEGQTQHIKEDLIIDCRDFTYNRKSEIDVRFYISSRYLMADFRKNVIYKECQPGKYIMQLTKNDLRYAASIVSMMIHSNAIASLIMRQSVQKYELDYVKHIESYCQDVVYDNVEGEEKFVNLPDKIVPILDMNKDKEITMFIGSKVIPIAKKVIPINGLRSSKDVISSMASIVSCQTDFNNFVVSVFNEGDRMFIELIPETGAA